MHPKHDSDIPTPAEWWRDDSNFGAILPEPLAGRLRPWLYGMAIAGAAIVVLQLLHVAVNWQNLAIVGGGLVALGVIILASASLLAQLRRRRQGAQLPPSQLSSGAPGAGRAATGVTVRLDRWQ